MNLVTQLVGTTLVVVHTERNPTDRDWKVFTDAWSEHENVATTQLVFSAGGAPDARQRQLSFDQISRRPLGPPTTAVMIDSLVARGAVTALSWFVRERIRAFSHSELPEACAFLGVTDVTSVANALYDLRLSSGLATKLMKAR